MKRLLALLLALCLCAGLCACGGSEPEASQPQETAGSQKPAENQVENQEELYAKSGTLEDGTTFTTYRRGGPEGTKAKLIYDTPDGTHHEEYYTEEGILDYSITTGADGSSFEVEYYPSGNMEKSIQKKADGSYEELRFLDNGSVDENGWFTSGLCYYEKRVSADGQVEERSENVTLEADGTMWLTVEWADGTVARTHWDRDGKSLERYQDNARTGEHAVELFYENGNIKSSETRYDDSDKYTMLEYHENGMVKHSYYRAEDGTEQEERITEMGYTTYFRSKSQQKEMEFFGDEQGNLLKYVDDGKVSEGNAIPSNAKQIWEQLKDSHVPDQGESETEEDADGTYWKTTTYQDGKVVKEHFTADDQLISVETTEAYGEVNYVEYDENGKIKCQKRLVNGMSFEYRYDEEGYETYYHEISPDMDVELIADETGKLAKVLVNGEEKTGTDFKWYSSEHNFRS